MKKNTFLNKKAKSIIASAMAMTLAVGRCIHLKEIKASAFAYCSHLIEVWIPSSVEIIHSDTVEESIFYECNEDLEVDVESTAAKEGWGEYWNYIRENMIAETYYSPV